jgi:hypothetical protein
MLDEKNVNCPYCGEMIAVLINPEEAGQHYIEDCQVCCRPITFSIRLDEEGEVMVSVHDENEVF